MANCKYNVGDEVILHDDCDLNGVAFGPLPYIGVIECVRKESDFPYDIASVATGEIEVFKECEIAGLIRKPVLKRI